MEDEEREEHGGRCVSHHQTRPSGHQFINLLCLDDHVSGTFSSAGRVRAHINTSNILLPLFKFVLPWPSQTAQWRLDVHHDFNHRHQDYWTAQAAAPPRPYAHRYAFPRRVGIVAPTSSASVTPGLTTLPAQATSPTRIHPVRRFGPAVTKRLGRLACAASTPVSPLCCVGDGDDVEVYLQTSRQLQSRLSAMCRRRLLVRRTILTILARTRQLRCLLAMT